MTGFNRTARGRAIALPLAAALQIVPADLAEPDGSILERQFHPAARGLAMPRHGEVLRLLLAGGDR
ncbi:MAG: hypothetical protein AAF722_07120 [Cyanobacteria bacterium P01_C01_bin.70]